MGKVGRPLGTFGGANLRRAIRENLEQEQEQPDPGNAHAQQGRQTDANSDVLPVAVIPHGLHSEFQAPPCASLLQQQVLFHAAEQAQRKDLEAEDLPRGDSVNPAKNTLFQGRQYIMSRSVSQATASTDRAVASLVLQAVAGLWCSFLNFIQQLIHSGQWKGLLFSVARRYDETPLRLRVNVKSETQPDETSGVAKVPKAAKIMQSEFYIHAVLQHVQSGRPVHLKGKVPTYLQCLQTTKAQQISQCQQAVMREVPNLRSTADCFLMRHMFVTTDRFGANLSAEKDLQSKFAGETSHKPFGWTQSSCVVHMVSSCEKAMSDVLGGHTGGMISVGLAMWTVGATKELRKCLMSIFEEELQIRVGEARGHQHRRALYDLFLPLDDSTCTEINSPDKKKRRKYSQRDAARRRAIISHYLNGDVGPDSPGIIHWSKVPLSREDLLKEIEILLVPALIPGPCPVLNRGKWLGCEKTFRWIGLLLSHFDLLPKIFKRWKGNNPASGATAAPSSLNGAEVGPQWGGWLRVAQIATSTMPQQPQQPESPQASGPAAEEDANEFLAAPALDPVTGDIDWAEQNRANIAKAYAWLDACLLLLRHLAPVFSYSFVWKLDFF